MVKGWRNQGVEEVSWRLMPGGGGGRLVRGPTLQESVITHITPGLRVLYLFPRVGPWYPAVVQVWRAALSDASHWRISFVNEQMCLRYL